MKPLQIFIGWDPRETLAYHVLAHSIIRRSSVPVSITPIARPHLAGVFTRPRGEKDSTDFSISRFLVPLLSGYVGHSIFMDCDMLCLADIAELEAAIAWDPDKAVLVVKHDYTPRETTKFLGQQQTAYPRKNWSSMMVFNNARCHALTSEYVNTASGLDLHRFVWLNDDEIGELPLYWNWLVGEYQPDDSARILHYTNGGPWFDAYRDCDHAAEWFAELEQMRSAA